MRRLSTSTEPEAPSQSVCARPKKSKEELLLLFKLAAQFGFCCMLVHKFKTELMLSIVKRLKPRTESNVYQASAYNIIAFPLPLAENLFPEEFLTHNSLGSKTWTLPTVESVQRSLDPVLALHKGSFVGGVSKALKTASPAWVRVVARP